MGFNVDTVKKSLESLISQGYNLSAALAYETTNADHKKKYEVQIKDSGLDASNLPNFRSAYEVWYSEALQYVKKFIPDRISDFTSLYKNEKRKAISFATYTISDALIGLKILNGNADPQSALPKLKQQVSILKSALNLVDSVVYTISFSIRADLFDSELDTANELLKSGFLRAAGAMCGVVLEKHLGQVCRQHEITLKKKAPTINDYNEELKAASIIGPPTWRYIQLLGDLRNLCCHDKNTEPTKEQATDLLTGTIKITKTVF